jgi:hypothetical protein
MPQLLLPRLKHEIDARLAELRPFVEEAAHLEAARRALLEDIASLPAAGIASELRAIRRRPAGREAPARRNGAGTAEDTVKAQPNGAPAPEPPEPPSDPTRDAILAIVDERPGVSLAEIVSVTKLAKGTVADIVAALKREGVVADEAGGVKLASRQPITIARA